MKDLIAYIAKALVDKPEEVVVTEAWTHGAGHENDTQCSFRQNEKAIRFGNP